MTPYRASSRHELPALPCEMYSPVGPIPVELVRGLRASDGEDCHGLWLEGARKIQIRAEDDRTVQWMTLWHEWTHAILWHAGVTLPAKKEESVCDAMGAALAAMLLADPPR